MKSQPKIDLILRKGVAKAFIAEKVHAEALSSDSSASHETQSATTNKLNTYGTVVEGQVATFASPNASSVVSNKPDGHSNRVCHFKMLATSAHFRAFPCLALAPRVALAYKMGRPISAFEIGYRSRISAFKC